MKRIVMLFASLCLMLSMAYAGEMNGSCGDGKCGSDMKKEKMMKKDGSCGDGKCGSDMKKTMKKDSDDMTKKSGNDKKPTGSCGAGKCG